MKEKLKASLIQQLIDRSPALMDLITCHGGNIPEVEETEWYLIAPEFNLQVIIKKEVGKNEYVIIFVDGEEQELKYNFYARDLSKDIVLNYFSDNIEYKDNILRFELNEGIIRMNAEYQFCREIPPKLNPVEYDFGKMKFTNTDDYEALRNKLIDIINLVDAEYWFNGYSTNVLNRLDKLQSKYPIRDYRHDAVRSFLTEYDPLYKGRRKTQSSLELLDLLDDIY